MALENKKFKSLKDLPKEITDKDLDKNNSYSIKDYFVLNYPEDFKDLAYNPMSTDDENKGLIVQGINIKMNDKWDISSKVIFDYPNSLFHTALFGDDSQL